MVQFRGALKAGDDRFAIVVSRFNDSVTLKLLDGALKTFAHYGVSEDRVTVAWVPGAFEIPLIAKRMANSGDYAAVCCLGAVIRGETTHDQYINEQVSRAVMDIGMKTGLPVLFGLLTCQSMEQALDRAGGKVGNKGSETALAAIEMVSLLRQIAQAEEADAKPF